MEPSWDVVLHLRHVPCKVLEADLSDAIGALGLDASRYDVYFPKRAGRRGVMNNFGYGFVTCREQEDAELFSRSFQGFRFPNIQTDKRMIVEPKAGHRPMGLRRSQMGSSHWASGYPETSSGPMARHHSQEGSLLSAYGHSDFSSSSESTSVSANARSPDLERRPVRPFFAHDSGQHIACVHSSATYFQAPYPCGDSLPAFCASAPGEWNTFAMEGKDPHEQRAAPPENWEVPPTRLVAPAQEACFRYQ
eukprot:TRINITY_DN5303_c0_g1_i1.p1 TRINITY_DN5303_c0_g1~~TRINITY_DN5303_c0_g1_i1.p1  ORF type:complete len:269 (+),score=25.20 TRINITY_DN5303_c0_g1_i1:61-807(+)